MCTCGGVVSSVTCTLAVDAVPPGLVATAVRVLVPSSTGTAAVKVPPLTLAATPLITTVAALLPTVPVTRIGLTFTNARFAGSLIVSAVDAPLTVTSTGADSTRVNLPWNAADTRSRTTVAVCS